MGGFFWPEPASDRVLESTAGTDPKRPYGANRLSPKLVPNCLEKCSYGRDERTRTKLATGSH